MNVAYCTSHRRFEMVTDDGTTTFNEDVLGPHHYTVDDRAYVHEGPLEGCMICGVAEK